MIARRDRRSPSKIALGKSMALVLSLPPICVSKYECPSHYLHACCVSVMHIQTCVMHDQHDVCDARSKLQNVESVEAWCRKDAYNIFAFREGMAHRHAHKYAGKASRDRGGKMYECISATCCKKNLLQ